MTIVHREENKMPEIDYLRYMPNQLLATLLDTSIEWITRDDLCTEPYLKKFTGSRYPCLIATEWSSRNIKVHIGYITANHDRTDYFIYKTQGSNYLDVSVHINDIIAIGLFKQTY